MQGAKMPLIVALSIFIVHVFNRCAKKDAMISKKHEQDNTCCTATFFCCLCAVALLWCAEY